MPDERPSNEVLRHQGNVIDQRQQQIDPAGRHRADDNSRNASGTKQPGRDDDASAEDTAGGDETPANSAGPKRSQQQPGQAAGNPQKGLSDAE